MQSDKNIDIKHALRQARQRSGLEQKQVALLLGLRDAAQISRFENGERIPRIETLIKLEIIYHTPIRILLQSLFEKFQAELAERRKKSKHLFPNEAWFLKSDDVLKQEEFCFYAEILKDRKPTSIEKRMIDKHVTSLINTMNNSNSQTFPQKPKVS